jgi:hypothetical protein
MAFDSLHGLIVELNTPIGTPIGSHHQQAIHKPQILFSSILLMKNVFLYSKDIFSLVLILFTCSC